MPGYGNKRQGGRGPGGGNRMGNAGNCLCLKCGYSESKKPGIPCIKLKCPQCGSALMREGSKHHQEALKKKK